MISRRSLLASFAAAFVADPERLLWVPGKKVISIPKPVVFNFPSYQSWIKRQDMNRYHVWVNCPVEYKCWIAS